MAKNNQICINMKPVYVTFVFDRKKVASSKREGAVEIRLTQARRTLYYNTGVRLLARQWHNGQVVGRADSIELQAQLDSQLQHVRKHIASMVQEDDLDLDTLLSRLREDQREELSFLDFAMQRTEIRCYGKSKDSRERYERFIKFLIGFGRIDTFSDVTEKAILDMEALLEKRKMKPSSRWSNYHRILNSFIIDAIDAGYMKKNPYKWLHIDKNKSKGGLGKYLTIEEFRRLENLHVIIPHLEKVRDLFVFQTYTCLSYTDLMKFDANLIYKVEGQPVYTAKRKKNGQEFTFLILPKAMKILEKYDKKLPVISNVKYNEYLKALALMGGIDKPISSHWARHTGATMLLNEGGLDMEVVAKVLGHSSTKITRQVYAKMLDDTIVKAMMKLQNK